MGISNFTWTKADVKNIRYEQFFFDTMVLKLGSGFLVDFKGYVWKFVCDFIYIGSDYGEKCFFQEWVIISFEWEYVCHTCVWFISWNKYDKYMLLINSN